MSAAPLLSFEDDAPRGNGEIGATAKIVRALDACGIDAPTTLYDEALAFAREGRLAPASERLRMLLCLDPGDAEAALLLGKLLAAREQWQDALNWIDTAASNGAFLPAGLRDMVEDGLRRQVQDAEDVRNRVLARERGEIRNLRNEAKRLRSENSSLEGENEALRKRVRMWSGTTAIVAGASSALLLAALLFGGGGAPDPATTATLEEGLAVAAAAPEGAAPVGAPSVSATVSVPVNQLPASAPGAAPAAFAAAPAAAVSAPAPVHVGKTIATHTVRKGENLGSIARKYYGDSSQFPLIQAANQDLLKGGNALQVGMKLKIPKAS